VTANTGRGARGYLLPAATAPGNPGENRLLVQTAAELDRLGLRPREVALDGGFLPGPTAQTLAALAPTRTFISGRAEPGSRRTRRRLARYRTGCEGRISHLKRGYHLRRSRLKATRASGSGPAGWSWPTTSTPSPSRLPDAVYLQTVPPPATIHGHPTVSRPPVYPGQVISPRCDAACGAWSGCWQAGAGRESDPSPRWPPRWRALRLICPRAAGTGLARHRRWPNEEACPPAGVTPHSPAATW
jgi:hypothetical protein